MLSLFLLVVVIETLPRSISLISNYFQYLSQKSIVDNKSDTDTRLIEVQTKKSLLKESINKMVTNDDNDYRLSSIISLFNLYAEKSMVDILSLKPGKISKEGDLKVQRVELILNSNYEQLYNFVRFIENSEKVIRINEIIMEQSASSNQILEISFIADLYINL
ncbi:MAG: type 4a pilus biogenesis protein PilO [bacterium]